jgi:hypothetical protein
MDKMNKRPKFTVADYNKMNKYHKYKFYNLTEDDKLVFQLQYDNWYPNMVFTNSSTELKNYREKVNKNESFVLIAKYHDFKNNPEKLCNFQNLHICHLTICDNVMLMIPFRDNYYNKLILYSKVPYFHELIFYIREVCKNEVPEDVIKYILHLLKIELLTI